MKKICSIILTTVLVMSSFVMVSAAGVTVDDITIAMNNVYDIKVAVTAEKKGVMTAMIANESGDGTVHGMRSDREPEEILNTNNEVVGYKYEFNFSMYEEAPTGTYIVRVGLDRVTTDKEFTYVCLDDKITFYDTLNGKASGEIKGYFGANSTLVPVDLGIYNAIADATVLSKVNDAIENLELATGVEQEDTYEQKFAKLKVVDNRFTATFAELMEVVKVITVNEAEWENVASKMLGTTFDDFYYNSATAGKAPLNVVDAFAKFQAEEADVEDFTLAEISKAFDRATLMLIKDTRSVGVLKEAFVKFAENNSIAADMTNIDALISAEKDAQLWIDLKTATDCADCDALVEKAETIAMAMIQNGGSTNNGTTGGDYIDKPLGSGGGGSLGGGGGAGSSSSGTSKPVEPKPEEPIKPVEPTTPTGVFSDIASASWAKEAIEALAAKGIINGRGDGTFAPNNSVTREEFVKIVIGAFDLLNEDAKADFGDVDTSRWSYAFIASANELGIVTGDGANFKPTGAMSRQDMAVVIYRTAQKFGVTFEGDAVKSSDANLIFDYAKDAIAALTAKGIMNGMGDGRFAPREAVTRAQAAKVVYELMNLVGGGK